MAPNFQHFWILGEKYGYFFTAFVFFPLSPPTHPPRTATLKAIWERPSIALTTSSRALSCTPMWELGKGGGGWVGVQWEV